MFSINRTWSGNRLSNTDSARIHASCATFSRSPSPCCPTSIPRRARAAFRRGTRFRDHRQRHSPHFGRWRRVIASFSDARLIPLCCSPCQSFRNSFVRSFFRGSVASFPLSTFFETIEQLLRGTEARLCHRLSLSHCPNRRGIRLADFERQPPMRHNLLEENSNCNAEL